MSPPTFSSSKASNRRRSSSDHHKKVEGKDRRVCLSVKCAQRIFELNEKLGHRTAGETIEWLLIQAKPAIDAVLGTNSAFTSPPPIFWPNAPMSPSVGMVFPTPLVSTFTRDTSTSVNLRASELETNVEIIANEIAKALFP